MNQRRREFVRLHMFRRILMNRINYKVMSIAEGKEELDR